MPAARSRFSFRRLGVPSLVVVTALLAVAFWQPTSVGAAEVSADFVVSGDVTAGSPVSFTDRSTGAAWVYWNFGDGSNSRERNPRHTFAVRGTYRVAYSVCASRTECATERKTVVVAAPQSPAMANADFSVSGHAVAGSPVSFNDRSTGAAWVYWNFGDGTSSRERNPRHTYAAGGSYQVAYSVCSSNTDCSTTRQPISVAAQAGSRPPTTPSSVPTTTPPPVPTTVPTTTPPPVPSTPVTPTNVSIAYAPLPPAVGEEILLISRVDIEGAHETISRWDHEWDFGDGTASTDQFPTHTYSRAGEFDVTLSVCDGPTDCATATTTVTVSPTPVLRPGTIDINIDTLFNDLTIEISSDDVGIIGSFFLAENTGEFSAPGNPTRFDVALEGGREQLEVAACYLSGPLYCQRIQRLVSTNTRAGGLMEPVTNVRAVAIDGTTVQVDWDHGVVDGSYDVDVRRNGEFVDRAFGAERPEIIEGLEPGNTYVLSVLARDANLFGARSITRQVVVRTPGPSVPVWVTGLRTQGSASDAITVSWDHPGAHVGDFFVRVSRNGTAVATRSVTAEKRSVEIDGLAVSTDYDVEVIARGRLVNGTRTESEARDVIARPTSPVTNPPPVDDFTVTVISPTVVQLDWTHPGDDLARFSIDIDQGQVNRNLRIRGPEHRSFLLTRLSAGRGVSFTITADSEEVNGSRRMSEPRTVSLNLPAAPPLQPTIVESAEVTVIDDTSVLVSWIYPASHRDPDDFVVSEERSARGWERSLVFRTRPGETYNFTIRTRTSSRFGVRSWGTFELPPFTMPG